MSRRPATRAGLGCLEGKVRRQCGRQSICTATKSGDEAEIIPEAGLSESDAYPGLIGIVPDVYKARLFTLEPHLVLGTDKRDHAIKVLLQERLPLSKVNLRGTDRGDSWNFCANSVKDVSGEVS